MMMAIALGLLLTAPLFGVGASAAVPACCRRTGAHHCMAMAGNDQAMDAHAGEHNVGPIPNRCPRAPLSTTAPQPHGFTPQWRQNAGIPLFVRPAALPQTEARYRIAFARSGQKRGPPIHLL